MFPTFLCQSPLRTFWKQGAQTGNCPIPNTFASHGPVARAIAPLVSRVADTQNNQAKPMKDYFTPIHSSVRLLSACFNCISQSQKDACQCMFAD